MDRLRTYSLPVSCESSDPGVKRVQLYPLADLHRPVNGNGCTASGDRREVQNRDRPATLRHRAYEPRAPSSIVTRTEAKTDALVDVLPFSPGPPSFVREHHQLGLHLHVDRSNRHACFLPAPRKVTFRIEQSLPLPLSDVYAPTGFNEVFPAPPRPVTRHKIFCLRRSISSPICSFSLASS